MEIENEKSLLGLTIVTGINGANDSDTESDNKYPP